MATWRFYISSEYSQPLPRQAVLCPPGNLLRDAVQIGNVFAHTRFATPLSNSITQVADVHREPIDGPVVGSLHGIRKIERIKSGRATIGARLTFIPFEMVNTCSDPGYIDPEV